MNETRILLADNHLIFVEALKNLIEPLFQVVGTARDGRSLLASAEELRPNVIITEISMPHLNGFEACERLRKTVPMCKTIFLTVNEQLESAEEAIRRGAFGYIPKKAPVAELFKAIRSVSQGKMWVSPLVSREPISVFVSRAKSQENPERLTFRQREVLHLLAEGKSMKEAADILNVTPRTIAFHKYSMMEHLGLSRSAELVRYATQRVIRGEGRMTALSC